MHRINLIERDRVALSARGSFGNVIRDEYVEMIANVFICHVKLSSRWQTIQCDGQLCCWDHFIIVMNG